MKILILCALINIISAQTFASTEILKQGQISITTDDLDGFAMKIPKDKRDGFFQDISRLDQTLKTILTMKHIVHYASNNHLLDSKEVESIVSSLIFDKSLEFNENDNKLLINNDIVLLKNYLILEESYKYVQKSINNSIKKDSLIELAKEFYLLNKDKYLIKENKDLFYFNIIYNEDNKKEKFLKAQMLQKELMDSNLDTKLFVEKYSTKEADMEVIEELNNFERDARFKKFTELVFNTEKHGMIKQILDANFRYSVIIIKDSEKEHIQDFSKVQDKIINPLMKKKFQRTFSNLVTKITQDEIVVDTKVFEKLQKRYINK